MDGLRSTMGRDGVVHVAHVDGHEFKFQYSDINMVPTVNLIGETWNPEKMPPNEHDVVAAAKTMAIAALEDDDWLPKGARRTLPQG